MKIIYFSSILALVAADRLENVYLPPRLASFAGGSLQSLTLPKETYSTSSSSSLFSGVTSYQAPPSGPVSPNYKTSYSGVKPIAILKYINENSGDGNYRFEFETENRISHQETGQIKNVGRDQSSNVVHGSYSYTGTDGQTYTVTYTADENGFQPQGSHLPTPPPIPEAIQKSLQINSQSGPSPFGGNGLYQTPSVSRLYLTPQGQTSRGYRS